MFNHTWLTNEYFVSMVREAWPNLSNESITLGMETFLLKLCLLKEKVKVWTHDKSLQMKDKIILIEAEINNLLLSSSSGLLSVHDNNKLLDLQKELKMLRDHEIS